MLIRILIVSKVITAVSMTHWPYVPQGGTLHGVHGPLHPFFGKAYAVVSHVLYTIGFFYLGYREFTSNYASKKRDEMRKKLLKGETVYLVGINAGGKLRFLVD